jgi:hypothetical protein
VATATVGILRALLTADASAYQATMKKSAEATKSFGDMIAKAGANAQKQTGSFTRLEKSFRGDRIINEAQKTVAVLDKMGGALHLTAQEQARVNRTMTEAIAKYRAFGQQAPQAMLDLAKATSAAGTPTKFLETKMIALGAAVGTLASNLVLQGVRALGSFALEAFEAAGQITDLAKQTGLSTDSIQEMQAVAAETGQSLDTFTNASYKLGLAINGGEQSVVNGLRALGLEWEELRGLSMDEQFRKVMQAAGEMRNEVERNRALVAVFGERLARELAKGVDGYIAIADAANKSTRAQLEALDELGDNFTKTWTRFKTDVRSAMAEGVMAVQNFGRWWARTMPKGFGLIGTGGDIPLPSPAPEKPPAAAFDWDAATPKITRATTALDKWNQTRAREREAIEEASQGMAWWLAGMDTAPAAIRSMDEGLKSAFIPTVNQSTDATLAFSQAIESQNASAVESSEQLATFWNTEFPETVRDSLDSMTRSLSTSLTDMLVGLRGFKDGFLDIWRSIRTAFSDILASMLNNFLSGFLKPMLGALAQAMAGRSLAGTALGNALGIGTAAAAGAASGAAAIPAAGAGGALTAGLTVAVPANIAPAAAGIGLGATIGLTAGIGGAALLAWGIAKKGWLRGGEEGTKVNPARDAFLRQYGGFNSLASLLTSVTGEPGGGRLFQALTTARTMKAFTAATSNIQTLLARRGVATPSASPSSRWPGSWADTTPTMTAASGAVMPSASMPVSAATAGGGAVTMNVTIQAWDRADLNDAFREEIIPRFKDALQMNQAGMLTAIRQGVG